MHSLLLAFFLLFMSCAECRHNVEILPSRSFYVQTRTLPRHPLIPTARWVAHPANGTTPKRTLRRRRSAKFIKDKLKRLNYVQIAGGVALFLLVVCVCMQWCCCCCRNNSDTFDLGAYDEEDEGFHRKKQAPLNAEGEGMPEGDRYEGLVGKVKEMYTRPHSFEYFRTFTWRIISSKFLYDCDACDKLINVSPLRSKMRCNTCHQVLHPKCEHELRLPCIPKPKKKHYLSRWYRIKVAERDASASVPENQRLKEPGYNYTDFFRRLTLPMLSHAHIRPNIPHVLIHCVRGIDAFHIHRENLYTDPAEEKQIGYQTLFDLTIFRQLQRAEDNFEPYQLTSAIKVVLFGLKEPLIPFINQPPFLEALQFKDNVEKQEKIRKALQAMDTKHANDERLTLVFMMLHWQRILSKSDINKMTVERLAPAIAHFVIRHMDCIEVTTMLLQATPSMWESIFDFPMSLKGDVKNV